MKGKLKRIMGAIGAAGLAATLLPVPSARAAAALRPFELVESGRTKDAHPATCSLGTADDWRRCQVVTCYDDGTVTVANGSRTERLRLKLDNRTFDLPPNSFWGRSGDGKVEIDSSKTVYEPKN